MSIKSKIQSLIDSANAKTGETDATLTDAVQTLVDGYGQGGTPVINPLSVTANGTYTAPSGVDGYSPVTVNVPQGITPSGSLDITENGTYDVTEYASANVNVSGGTEITDGIVVKARNANGAITEVEKYGNCDFYEFGVGSVGFRNFPFGYTTKVTLHNCTKLGESVFHNRFITQIIGLENITECGQNCFNSNGLTNISLPNVTYVGSTCFRSLYVATDIYLPKLTNQGQYIFQASTTLQNVQIGSVGYPAKHNGSNPFIQCTQTGLTITAYCAGANADALLANYRQGATNATIIIKASEDTTYGGVSYAAGDTMITSEVA